MKTSRFQKHHSGQNDIELKLLWLVVTVSLAIVTLAVAGLWLDDAHPASAAASPAPNAPLAACYARVNDDPTNYATVQAAVDAAQPGDTVKVAGTCAGVAARAGVTQTVYIDKDLTLQGGYTTTNWTTPDPAAYTTTLDAQRLGRVLYVTGEVDVTVAGLHLTGGDAQAMENDGGGGYVLSATFTLRDSTVISNTGDGLFLSSSDATIQNSTFEDNGDTGITAFNQSLAVLDSTWIDNAGCGLDSGWQDLTVEHSTFYSNTRGLTILASPLARIEHNDIRYNTATRGGGLDIMYSNVRLVNNMINRNTANSSIGGVGGALYVSHSHAQFENNMIGWNEATFKEGGGIAAWNIYATFDRDWIVGNHSGQHGGGMAIFNSDAVVRNVTLANNTANGQGSGLYDEGARLTMLHTTVANNTGGDGSGIYLTPGSEPYVDLAEPAVVTLTNIIIAGQAVGLYADTGAEATLDHTLWWNNTADTGGGGSVTTSDDLAGDPAFVDAAIGDYHLTSGSAAIDAGTNAGVRRDRDTHIRPVSLGYDVGADEYATGVVLDLDYAAAVPSANPGDSVAYTLVVTSAGTGTATGVSLNGVLDAAQRATAVTPSQGSCSITDGGWGGSFSCFPGDLSPSERVDIAVTLEVSGTITPWQQIDSTVTATANETQNAATATLHGQDCQAAVAGGATYGTIQAAVDAAASGGTVTVSGVCLGAAEHAGTWQQVILDKDITLQGAVGVTPTLDALGQGRGIYATGGASVTVAGLRITGGDARDHLADGNGGGLYVKAATAALHSLEVDAGHGYGGGGIGVSESTVTLRDSHLHHNHAYYTTLAQTGGGGFQAWKSEVHAYGNVIDQNIVHWNGVGGGVALDICTGVLDGNRIADNLSTDHGGGMYVRQNNDLIISRNVISGNTAAEGGGISNWGDGVFQSNEIRANVVYSHPSSSGPGVGGGVYLTGGAPRFVNNLLTKNHADLDGSALYLHNGSTPHLLHTTIADNTGPDAVFARSGNNATFTNTIVSGHTQGISVSQGATVTLANTLWWDNYIDGGGNVIHTDDVAGDPAYVDAPGGDYHLTAGSAALDRGRATDVTTDIDGDPRPMGSAPDLGADEYVQASVCIARINDDPTEYTTVQAAVDAAQPGDTVKVAGTCTGVAVREGLTQTAYIDKGLTLQGGYNIHNWTTPDPEAYPTTLDAQRQGRVLYVTGEVDVTVAGLRITGGDAQGLGGYDWKNLDAGGGGCVLSATFTLSDSTVVSNTATNGGGLYLKASDAAIHDSTFDDNEAGSGGGVEAYRASLQVIDSTFEYNRGGGLESVNQYLVVQNCDFQYNESQSIGGGISAVMNSFVLLDNNYFGHNTASRGGAMSIMGSNVRLVNNLISYNTATGRNGAGGVYIGSSHAQFVYNLINVNAATNTNWGGGGVVVSGSDVTFDRDWLIRNSSSHSGGGIGIAFDSDVVFRNAIVANNSATAQGSGIYVEGSQVAMLHGTVANNTGGDGSGLYLTPDVYPYMTLPQPATLTLTNTIVASQTVGVYADTGSQATLDHTLWWANGANTGGGGTAMTSHNLSGDPAFVDSTGYGFHITSGSAALDAASNAGLRYDVDDDVRAMGMGFDVGADEYEGVALDLAYDAAVPSANPGDSVAYTLVVTGAGTGSATGVSLGGAMDAAQRVTGVTPSQGTCAITDGGWGGSFTCSPGDLSPGTRVDIAVTVEVAGTVTPRQRLESTVTATANETQNAATATLHGQDCQATVSGGATHGTVQDAVDAAASGGTVTVSGVCLGATKRAGTYQQVYIDKDITIQGNATLSPTLDALGQGRGVYVTGGAAATLEALYLTGGEARVHLIGDNGGGLYVNGATATLRNLDIAENRAYEGGGLAAEQSTLTLRESRVHHNVAYRYGGGVYVSECALDVEDNAIFDNIVYRQAYGGGIDLYESTGAFSHNRVFNNTSTGQAGGVRKVLNRNLRFTHNTIHDNLAGLEGGGLYIERDDFLVEANEIVNNTAQDGGGIHVAWAAPRLVNNLLAGNHAVNHGGALYFFNAHPHLLHTTIADNTGDYGVYAYTWNYDVSNATFTNTIVSGHTQGISVSQGATVTLANTLWWDNTTDHAGNVIHTGDVSGDPAYVDAPGGDYHITAGSAALDRGRATDVTTDIDGDPRPMGSAPDLGADEFVDVLSDATHLIAVVAFDNDLSPYTADVIERVRSGTAANADVVATLLVDGAQDGDTQVLAIANGTVTPAAISGLTDEENTADPAVLTTFLDGARALHPDHREVLALVGHGAGLAPEAHVDLGAMGVQANLPPLPRGHDFTPVDVTSGAYLSTPELGRALDAATDSGSQPFDLVFFDQCFMGNLDTLYEVRDAAQVFIASPNYAWAAFPYDAYLAAMTPGTSNTDLAQALVDAYGQRLDADHPYSLLWMRGSDVAPVAATVNALGDALRASLADPGAADNILAATMASRFVDTTLCTGDLALCPPDELADLFSLALQLQAQFASGSPVHTAAGDVITALGAVHVSGSSGHPWVRPELTWDVANVGLTVLAPLTPTLSPDVAWRASLYTHTTPLTAVWSPQPTRTVAITQPWAYPADGRWDDFIAAWYGQGDVFTPTVGQWCHGMPPALVITGTGTLSLVALPNTDNSVHLDWTPSVDPAVVDYALYVKGPGYLMYSILTLTSQTIHEHTDLLPGTYTYIVAARNARGEVLARSPEVSVEVGVPFISAINPNFGINDAPTEIFIHGAHLAPAPAVRLDSRPLTVTYTSDNLIIAVVPAGLTPGWYDVTVEVATASVLRTDAFEVVDAVGVDDLRSSSDWLWTDPLVLRIGGAANSRVGLNVQRLGGTQTWDHVDVAFDVDGVTVGRGQTQPLAPYDVEATTPVAWTPSAAGTYTLCAHIDPDDAIAESDEANNTVCRAITVLPPARDTLPPVVDDFTINDDALNTDSITATLDVTATDPGRYSSGVSHIKFVEFEYIWSARRWVPIVISNWVPYPQAHQDHPWTLLPTFGVRYMSAWASDNAGNISLTAGDDYIDLLPQTQTGYVWANGVDFYRFYLSAGQGLDATLTSVEGDADLYVWGPDGALVAYSQLPSGDDIASFTASLQGTYQIEVHGHTAARYRLAMTRTAQAAQAPGIQSVHAKSVPAAPAVPVDSWPAFYDLTPLPFQLSATDPLTVSAGTTAIYTHTLHNTSAEALTVTVEATNADGWDVLLRADQQATAILPVPLGAGEMVTFTVEVTVPAGATPGHVSPTPVTATLTSDPQTYVVITDVTHVAGGERFIFLPMMVRH